MCLACFRRRRRRRRELQMPTLSTPFNPQPSYRTGLIPTSGEFHSVTFWWPRLKVKVTADVTHFCGVTALKSIKRCRSEPNRTSMGPKSGSRGSSNMGDLDLCSRSPRAFFRSVLSRLNTTFFKIGLNTPKLIQMRSTRWELPEKHTFDQHWMSIFGWKWGFCRGQQGSRGAGGAECCVAHTWPSC